MPAGHEDSAGAPPPEAGASLAAGTRSAGAAAAAAAAAACLGVVALRKVRLMGAFGIVDWRPRAVACRRQLLQIILGCDAVEHVD